MKVAVDIVKKYGGLFICDEVQTGFGRTGKMWGVDHEEGVVPDIVTMAKGIANGYPISAVVTTAPIAQAWTGGNISTFGGNTISCAAANATVGAIVEEKLVENSASMGKPLRSGLDALKAKHSTIGEVRGRGLMQGLELVRDEKSGDRTFTGGCATPPRGDEKSWTAHWPGRTLRQRPSRGAGPRGRQRRHRHGARGTGCVVHRRGGIGPEILGLSPQPVGSSLVTIGVLAGSPLRPAKGAGRCPQPVLVDLGQLEAHRGLVDLPRERFEVGRGALPISAGLRDLGAGPERLRVPLLALRRRRPPPSHDRADPARRSVRATPTRSRGARAPCSGSP